MAPATFRLQVAVYDDWLFRENNAKTNFYRNSTLRVVIRNSYGIHCQLQWHTFFVSRFSFLVSPRLPNPFYKTPKQYSIIQLNSHTVHHILRVTRAPRLPLRRAPIAFPDQQLRGGVLLRGHESLVRGRPQHHRVVDLRGAFPEHLQAPGFRRAGERPHLERLAHHEPPAVEHVPHHVRAEEAAVDQPHGRPVARPAPRLELDQPARQPREAPHLRVAQPRRPRAPVVAPQVVEHALGQVVDVPVPHPVHEVRRPAWQRLLPWRRRVRRVRALRLRRRACPTAEAVRLAAPRADHPPRGVVQPVLFVRDHKVVVAPRVVARPFYVRDHVRARRVLHKNEQHPPVSRVHIPAAVDFRGGEDVVEQ